MITHANKELLNPCPFCGSRELNVVQRVECNSCGAFGPTPAEDGDLSGWNQLKGVSVAVPAADQGFEHPHGGTTYFDGPEYREAVVKAIEAAGLQVTQ